MNARDRRRAKAVDALIDELALQEMEQVHGTAHLAPVAVVIASYKERDNIEGVLQTVPKQLCGLDASVVVVVDGEDDGTAEIVRQSGSLAVVCPVNRGQGAALRLGYRVALEHGATYVVTADADGQTDPRDLEVVLEPVVRGEADFGNGSRRLGTTLSRGAVRNLGVSTSARILSLLTRTTVTDTTNPVRAFRAELTKRLELSEPQYQASELLIGAIMSGARYVERPVTMLPRASGRSKKGGDLLYGFSFGRVFFSTWWRELRHQQAVQGD